MEASKILIQTMAKRGDVVNIMLINPETGTFYVLRKNPKKITGKMQFRKYDKKIRKHATFVERKLVYKAN